LLVKSGFYDQAPPAIEVPAFGVLGLLPRRDEGRSGSDQRAFSLFVDNGHQPGVHMGGPGRRGARDERAAPRRAGDSECSPTATERSEARRLSTPRIWPPREGYLAVALCIIMSDSSGRMSKTPASGTQCGSAPSQWASGSLTEQTGVTRPRSRWA
jgi:hypothetical protein